MLRDQANASDSELLRCWRAGDHRAGNLLLQRYWDSLFRFFCNKADEQLASDLIQQTMLACVRGRDRLRDDNKFAAYLFRTAYNTFKQSMRMRYRDQGRSPFAEQSIASLGITPNERMTQKAEQRLLLRALRNLVLDDQVILELYYWENLSRREVALLLDIQDGAAASRIRRARERLKKMISRLASDPELGYRTTANFEHWLADLRKKTPDIPRS
ncbi:MAG: sigma-70 family RNA polymerase sigma factor [Myxococcales bacterium]|nr:sigma-70 family RNA polymerase sigma factor [Myxococcales bacterium]MCB9754634.1 sigma-70 family RNA polymerase sigma factor [Myxococcales bacterium]